jgi:hypothetical protein
MAAVKDKHMSYDPRTLANINLFIFVQLKVLSNFS